MAAQKNKKDIKKSRNPLIQTKELESPDSNLNVSKPKVVDQATPSVIKLLAQRILAATFTKNQMRKRMRLLKDFVNFKLYQNIDTKKNFTEEVSSFLVKYPLYNPDAHWLISLGEDLYTHFKELNTNELLNELTGYLESLQGVVLFLPFELNDEVFYEKMITLGSQKSSEIPIRLEVEVGEWFKKNISPTILFEPSFDPDLVGGCALSINGNYKDFSLRSKILENQDKIINSLKETLNS